MKKTAWFLKPRCFTLFGRSNSPLNLAGTQATGAGVYSFRSSVYNCLDALDVGLKGSVGSSVGVGNLNAKGDRFAADIAFCHGAAPP